MPTVFSKIALEHYLVVGSIMFGIGLIGFMCRRNLIIMFLCSELMFQGVAIHFVAFGAYWHALSGQAFVIFILALAAAEAALALAIIVLLFRQKQSVDSQAFRELRG